MKSSQIMTTRNAKQQRNTFAHSSIASTTIDASARAPNESQMRASVDFNPQQSYQESAAEYDVSLQDDPVVAQKKPQRQKLPIAQSLFDMDYQILLLIKEEFPENQKGPTRSTGLSIDDFVTMLQKYVTLDAAMTKKLQGAVDHVHPDYITWKEFILWFQEEGMQRDNLHNAQMYQIGLTRIEEEEVVDISPERVEPKIELVLPISLKSPKLNLVLVTFENKLVKFFDLDTWNCVHNFRIEQQYKLEIPGREKYQQQKRAERQMSLAPQKAVANSGKAAPSSNAENRRSSAPAPKKDNICCEDGDVSSHLSGQLTRTTQNKATFGNKVELQPGKQQPASILSTKHQKVKINHKMKKGLLFDSPRDMKDSDIINIADQDVQLVNSKRRNIKTGENTTRNSQKSSTAGSPVTIDKTRSRNIAIGRIRPGTIMNAEKPRPLAGVKPSMRKSQNAEKRSLSQMQEADKGGLFVSKQSSTATALRKGLSTRRRGGNVDPGFEILGLDSIAAYDTRPIQPGGDSAGQQNEALQNLLEGREPAANFGAPQGKPGDGSLYRVSQIQIKPRRDSKSKMMVRHGGIMDGLFRSQREKEKDESKYQGQLDMIDKSIRENNARIDILAKEREGRSKMTVRKQFTSNKAGQQQDYSGESFVRQELALKPLRTKTHAGKSKGGAGYSPVNDYSAAQASETQKLLRFQQDQSKNNTKANYSRALEELELHRMYKSPVPNLPTFNTITGHTNHDFSHVKIEKALTRIGQKYDELAGAEPDEFLAQCNKPTKLTVKTTQFKAKLNNAEKRLAVIKKIIAQPFTNDAGTQRRNQNAFGMTQKGNTGKKPPEDDNEELIHDKVVTIKKSDKTAYAPGGALDRIEYAPKAPQITGCFFYQPKNLLYICFIGGHNYLFQINGLSKDELDIENLNKIVKTPFTTGCLHIGIHRVSQELIGTFGGEGQFQIIIVDPQSKRFGEVLLKKIMPLKKTPTFGKSTFFDDKIELISNIIFDESCGIIVTFFRGFFKLYEPINFKQIWHHETVDPVHKEDQFMTIVAAGFSKKFSYLAIGGVEGRIIMYDIVSQMMIADNNKVHTGEIIKIYFYDPQSQLISCARDRQICLWNSQNFELLQTIRDLNYYPNFFNEMAFCEDLNVLMACTFKIKNYKIRKNEKIQIHNLQTKVLVDQTTGMMREMILEEARKNMHTKQGKLIYQKILAEESQMSAGVESFLAGSLQQRLSTRENLKIEKNWNITRDQRQEKMLELKEHDKKFQTLGKYQVKANDFGKVLFTNTAKLVDIQTNYDPSNPDFNLKHLEIHTIDSDFMIRRWNLSQDHSKKSEEYWGKCIQSIIVKPCDTTGVLSEADVFKNEMALGSEAQGAIKRTIQAVSTMEAESTIRRGSQQKVIAICDQAGIMQVNNFNSGSILMSQTNPSTRLEINCLHFLNKGKIYIAAGCSDGTIIFFLKPTIQLNKDTQGDMFPTVVRKHIHHKDIIKIVSNSESVIFGGFDNKISVFKIVGMRYNSTITMPALAKGKQVNFNHVQISDMHFVDINLGESMNGSSQKASIEGGAHLLVLQNSGAVHLVHPSSNCVLQSFVVDSELFHGQFALSTHPHNPNGLFLVNERGTVAETYALARENKLKRLPSFRDAHKNRDVSSDDSHDARGRQQSCDSALKSDSRSHNNLKASESPPKKGDWLQKKVEKAHRESVLAKLDKNVRNQFRQRRLERAEIERQIVLDSEIDYTDPKNKKKLEMAIDRELFIKRQNQASGGDHIQLRYKLQASWCPQELQFDQRNLGHPHPDHRKRLSSGYNRQINSLGSNYMNTCLCPKIIGAGLCVYTMSLGEVILFDFATGERLYQLNTHQVYLYPADKIHDSMENKIELQGKEVCL